MDDKKKKFIAPEADVLDFANDDIITLSAGETAGWNDGGEWWMEQYEKQELINDYSCFNDFIRLCWSRT